MGRMWQHDASAAWLEARRSVLTATDIAKLLPEFKRCKKQKPGVVSPGFAAVWAEKNTETPVDTKSFNAAARGHIMEPWVVKSWNQQTTPEYRMCHWDDCIIVNDGVGFSPDALNLVQRADHPKLRVSNDKMVVENIVYDQPTMGLEIKCYEPGHHMKCVIEDCTEHKELIQIATAFYVLPKLEKMALVFCCPGAPVEMTVDWYTREDLKNQIELVKEIADMYKKTVEECQKWQSMWKANFTEEEVYEDYINLYSF